MAVAPKRSSGWPTDAASNARRYVAAVKSGEIALSASAAFLHLEQALSVLSVYEEAEQREVLAEIEATEYLETGDEVLHIYSGWTGTVSAVEGALVTVDPVRAGGKEWNAITVERGELRKLREDESAH